MEWLGSGAQGAVYKCRLRNEIVAVKRVKDKKEADIRHLRQLHHPNIIRFKYYIFSHLFLKFWLSFDIDIRYKSKMNYVLVSL